MTDQELADMLHAELCDNGDRNCARYKPESGHHDFYQMRADGLHERLDGVIGSANVKIAAKAVLDEVL